MPVPSVITDLSTTAGSNSPAGTDAIGTTADDYIRAQAAFIAQLRDGSKNLALGSAGAPSCAFTGDSNTGIYSPTAGQVGISCDATAAVIVDATGTTVAGTIASSGKVYGNYSGSGNGLGKITVSTSSPSGGSAGDIWILY